MGVSNSCFQATNVIDKKFLVSDLHSRAFFLWLLNFKPVNTMLTSPLVDTCCIDKSSSTELSEAINSMFRWYQESSLCYVYLADVHGHGGEDMDKFFQSKWFTRGWTLQELVAPTALTFYNSRGLTLFDKRNALKSIQSRTSIPATLLSGKKSLSDFSTEEKFSWAQGRETKREEDMAYCLFGLFDVHMPLIYGEGKKKAMDRLRRKVLKAVNNNSAAPGHSIEKHEAKGYPVSPGPLNRSLSSLLPHQNGLKTPTDKLLRQLFIDGYYFRLVFEPIDLIVRLLFSFNPIRITC